MSPMFLGEPAHASKSDVDRLSRRRGQCWSVDLVGLPAGMRFCSPTGLPDQSGGLPPYLPRHVQP